MKILVTGATGYCLDARSSSERMPVHTVPSWMDSMVQPIAIVDVPEALVERLHHDMTIADGDFQTTLLPKGHVLVGLDDAFRRTPDS